jgi:hypothetical protein
MQHDAQEATMCDDYEVLGSQKRTGFRGGSNVDIVGVVGSIPTMPTILFNNLAEVYIVADRFAKPVAAASEAIRRA